MVGGSAESALSRAYELEQSGLVQDAEQAFLDAVAEGHPDGELLLAGFRHRHGNVAGAIEILRVGEQRGDVRCMCDLGGMLQEQGDIEGAEAAFRRADATGTALGAYVFGQFLYNRGDIAGSIEANRRADALGHAAAAYNLGFLLLKTGQLAEAEAALRRADERGDAAAALLLGRRFREREMHVEADAAFQRADARGSADGALEVGATLHEAGDLEGSIAAFERAVERGNQAVVALVERVRDELASRAGGVEAPGPTTSERDLSGECYAAMFASHQLVTEIARARGALAKRHATLEAQVRDLEIQRSVAEAEHRTRQATLDKFLASCGLTRTVAGANVAAHGSARFVQRAGDGTYRLADSVAAEMSNLLSRAAATLREAQERRFGRRGLEDEAQAAVNRYCGLLDGLHRWAAETDGELAQLRLRAAEEMARAASELGDPVRSADRAARFALAQAPAVVRPWSDSAWEGAVPPQGQLADMPVLAGWLVPQPDASLAAHSGFGCDVRVPFFVETDQHLRLSYGRDNRDKAIELVQSIAVRRLCSAQPSDLILNVFDPVGLGQSVSELLGLADFDADLIGGKVWSAPQDLRALLSATSAHIEMVVQKYLRAEYEDMRDFNATAGEIAEPVRYLVLLDYPNGFDRDSYGELVRILQNGPRCGVHVLLGEATDATADPYLALPALPTMPTVVVGAGFVETHGDYKLRLTLETDSTRGHGARIRSIVETIGRASAKGTEKTLSLSRLLELYGEATRRGMIAERSANSPEVRLDGPNNWWQESTVRGISAPIGQRGAREVSVLTFDSADHAGALMVGRPGSGKSTLLHSYIIGSAVHYGPDELELYLIDFKEGVEFKAYAAGQLPHARCVAVESDREFGLSVLQSLVEEIAHRGEVLRSSGGQYSGVEALRRATGERMPRVLLVFDEFHVLFAKNDKIGLAAADLLEQVIRQGRGFGVHVLLGSQSLSGLDALGSHVPQLLPVRILLAASEQDSRRVLGEANNAGDYLTKRGEGVLNPAGGNVEANERFQGALLGDQERLGLVRSLRALADRTGFTRRPIVFDGTTAPTLDNELVEPFVEAMRSTSAAPLRVRVGVPMSIHGAADLLLRREAGANVLVVGRASESAPTGLGASAGAPISQLFCLAASLACSPSGLDVLDFMSIDDGVEDVLQPFVSAGRVRVHRRRALVALIRGLRAEIERRVAEDDQKAPPVMTALFGLHRARDLTAGFSLDGDAELQEAIEIVLREGPEVGVHTWAWVDTVASLSRRLTGAAIREFGWRIASKMSADDSHNLIGNDEAAALRQHQIVYANEDLGVDRRATIYTLPDPAWTVDLLRVAGRRS